MTQQRPHKKANRPFYRGSSGEAEYPWPWQHEDFLRVKLFDERKTPAQIADDWGCSERTVWRHMRRHGLVEDYRGVGRQPCDD